jgi:SAM-dependent methyltransferase
MQEHDVFFTLHRDLPREGPGHRESTAHALFLIPTLVARPRVLDLGCGPGAQTLDLAVLLPDAEIVAVDAHRPFLEALQRRAQDAGLASWITATQGDLAAPPGGPYDLIWCEGAAYLLGFERALRTWEPLLTEGGSIALSEPVWLTERPSERVRAFWSGYPDLQSLETRRRQIAEAGLVLHGDFVLPERDWWEYYGPLAARMATLRQHPHPPELARVMDEHEEEMAVYREGSASYGYAFFVVGRPEAEEGAEA